MHSRISHTSEFSSPSIESTVINMAKDEDIAAKALCQLLKAGFIADGMDPGIAQILAGRACEVGVKKVARDLKKEKSTRKRQLNDWQKFVKAKASSYKYKTGSKKGQINLKAMSRDFKKTRKGKK
jgi:hypothetical protein